MNSGKVYRCQNSFDKITDKTCIYSNWNEMSSGIVEMPLNINNYIIVEKLN